MLKYSCRLFLFCFLLKCSNLIAGGSENISTSSGIFSSHVSEGAIYYTKLENSGCTTSLKTRDDSMTIHATYGDCNVFKECIESVREVAQSVLEIVKRYKFEQELVRKKQLSLNYTWKVSHWPLIDALNSNPDWPDNVFKAFGDDLTSKEFREKYRTLLSDEIMSESVYLPFVRTIETLSCSMELSREFFDPLIMPGRNITKDKLVKWGVYRKEEVRKEIYPQIKGAIIFDLSCE